MKMNGYRQTIVVAAENDFKTVTEIMHNAGMTEKVLGRVDNSINQLRQSIGKYAPNKSSY